MSASDSLLLLTLLGIPSIFTLTVVVKKKWCCLWKAALVWSVSLALLVWGLDLQPITLEQPLTLAGNAYTYILVLFVVSVIMLSKPLGEAWMVVLGIASVVVGAVLLFWTFPMSSGWSDLIDLGDQWTDLIDLIGCLWIGGVALLILLITFLGKRGGVIGTAVLLFVAQITYIGVLTWYQVTFGVLVPHSIVWMLAIYTVLFAFVTATIPQFRRDIYGAGASLFIAVVLVYFAYTVILPCLITSTTGYQIVVSGQWLF